MKKTKKTTHFSQGCNLSQKRTLSYCISCLQPWYYKVQKVNDENKIASEINTGINGELHLLASYQVKVNKNSNKLPQGRGGGW